MARPFPPLRVPLVPWLWPSDFDAGRRAMWDVDYAQDKEHLSCWPVSLYGQHGESTCYLLLHATRGNGNDGGTITLAISEQPRFDLYAADVLVTMPAQSNPQRQRWYTG